MGEGVKAVQLRKTTYFKFFFLMTAKVPTAIKLEGEGLNGTAIKKK